MTAILFSNSLLNITSGNFINLGSGYCDFNDICAKRYFSRKENNLQPILKLYPISCVNKK